MFMQNYDPTVGTGLGANQFVQLDLAKDNIPKAALCQMRAQVKVITVS